MITHIEVRTDMMRDRYLLIALNGSEPLGRLNINHDDRGAWVSNVWVEEPYRNKGVATAMLRAVAQVTHNAKVYLLVASDNPNARRLYEKLGLKLLTTLVNMNGPGKDELLMTGYLGIMVNVYKVNVIPLSDGMPT